MTFHNLRYSSFMTLQLFTLLDLFPQVSMLFSRASQLFNNFIHKVGNILQFLWNFPFFNSFCEFDVMYVLYFLDMASLLNFVFENF